MDRIIIKGLAVDTLIGVYAWERERNTRLVIDVRVNTDLSAAMRSDHVKDTIDYAQVAACIQQVGNASRFELLEALANEMFKALFLQFAITEVQLDITKPNILPDAQQVMVSIVRQRQDYC